MLKGGTQLGLDAGCPFANWVCATEVSYWAPAIEMPMCCVKRLMK